jgi:hypothetical protein
LAPTEDENKLIRSFKGDVNRLGPCEKFFLAIIDVPNVKARAQGLLYQYDFDERLVEAKRRLDTFTSAVKQVSDSARLRRFLKAVLVLGNKMNGVDAKHRKGTVRAFTLNSLHQLHITKTFGDVPVTALVYLVRVLQKVDPDLLKLTSDFSVGPLIGSSSSRSSHPHPQTSKTTTSSTARGGKQQPQPRRGSNSNSSSSSAALLSSLCPLLVEAKRLPIDAMVIEMTDLRQGLMSIETLLKEAAGRDAGGMAGLMGGGGDGPTLVDEYDNQAEGDGGGGGGGDGDNVDDDEEKACNDNKSQLAASTSAPTTTSTATTDTTTTTTTNTRNDTSTSGASNINNTKKATTSSSHSRRKRVVIRRRHVEPLPSFAALAQRELEALQNQLTEAQEAYKSLLLHFKEASDLAADELFSSLHLFLMTFEGTINALDEQKRKAAEVKRRAKEKENLEKKKKMKSTNGGGGGDDPEAALVEEEEENVLSSGGGVGESWATVAASKDDDESEDNHDEEVEVSKAKQTSSPSPALSTISSTSSSSPAATGVRASLPDLRGGLLASITAAHSRKDAPSSATSSPTINNTSTSKQSTTNEESGGGVDSRSGLLAAIAARKKK